MQSHSRLLSVLGGLLCFLYAGVALHGEGSPPLITDDPGTPGNGHWEINLGCSTVKRPDGQSSELPLIDFNYGIGERLQLKYEVPYLQVTSDGAPSASGLGNSSAGVKWRFYDAGEKGLAVSMFPQWEFNNPGSASADRGLVEHGSALLLPFQFAREVGPLSLTGQVGREFRRSGDRWIYGITAGHHFGGKLEIALELAGSAATRFQSSQLATNLGVVIDLSLRTSFMFSLGRELHNHDEPRATFLGYVGVQWRL